ncbi:Pr6Pr family membrane protein [Micromonospora hortensis]|uniref:Pr6Pr family membrane protein n=1 Tax=Micromonospora hortensis TaxID=2911209 RepID=UPI001EE8CAD3|nr:Pr6Pr family membrane protein [Micromonospora hortensis]MCG5453018.1 Pr6Pr family membrane protein [Micromonospora hortensis]
MRGERGRGVDRVLLVSTAVVIAVGLVLALVAARDEPVELLFYFTVQVNLAYLVLLLTGGGDRVRTALTVYLVGTALVFVLVLANPWSRYAMVANADARGTISDAGNLLLHVVAPPLAAAHWLRHGPQAALRPAYAVSLLGYPLLWLTVILVRGALSPAEDRYLYPFLDVPRLGYPTVARNALLFAVTLLLIALTAVHLTRRRGKGLSGGVDGVHGE